tara:strand:+ start:60 stop:1895 length:1836 start_codon:yes stop_codon:yes gene_type:complete
MVQTTLDSFISNDVYQEIDLSRLQKMTNEEVTHVVEDEKIELITSPSNTSGYWGVSINKRKKLNKFSVSPLPRFGITEAVYGFRSPIAAAIYISRKLRHPTVSHILRNPRVRFTEPRRITRMIENYIRHVRMMRIVESEEIELITSPSNTTGYWHVGKESSKKFMIVKTPQFQITGNEKFFSKIAAAIYISQKVGDPMVCRAISQNYPEDSETQILTNLRIPSHMYFQNGIHQGGTLKTWRRKSEHLLTAAIRNTKKRNSRGREHDEVEWNLDEFRKWVADELEKLGFRCCYLIGLKLTPENASLERLDESKGYSSANCVLIDIHFQSGQRQWSREKVQSLHHLRKKKIEMDFVPFFFKMLEFMVNACHHRTKQRNEEGRNHSPSEVTVEKLIHEYVKQDGRCYYLNIPLRMKGDWQMSVERLDESKGYIDGNWVLIVLETQNGNAQWTKGFVESAWEPFSHPNPQLSVSEEDLIDKYNSHKIRSAHAISIRNISPWTSEEDQVLKASCKEALRTEVKWEEFTKPDILEDRTLQELKGRHTVLKNEAIRNTPKKMKSWTREEDEALMEACKKVHMEYIAWGKFIIPEQLKHRTKGVIKSRWKLYLKSLSAV